MLLHIHICLFYPFANKRLQLVTDIYEFHLISKKCFIYNSIWRFDYRFFFLLFIRIICKLSTEMNHCAHLKNSHCLFSIPSFKHKWADFSNIFCILNRIKSVQSGMTRLVIHCIDLAQLTSVNFTCLSLFLCWKFWIVFKRISFWEKNLKRWQCEWRQH